MLQELLLRQRVEFVLIVCPASVTLQWRDEMERRFGLHFEIYNRAFVARRRQERGFGVNPWTTHTPLHHLVPDAAPARVPRPAPRSTSASARKKSLLILDEAHTAAPASATQVRRRLAHHQASSATSRRASRTACSCSATPHNGHSNSFSALLEILDPQRFTRGVQVAAPTRSSP